MKSIKKVLFWVTFIPFGVIFLCVLHLKLLVDWACEIPHHWETWCFGKPEGMTYVGDGIWIGDEWAKLKEGK